MPGNVITNDDLFVYDFGERRVWPKPKLETPWDAVQAYHDLRTGLSQLAQYAEVRGRDDHFIDSLDTLRYALQKSMFQVMVLREALTGYQTNEAQDAGNAR